MQLLTTLVLCRPHGMMECWNSGQKIDVIPIVQDLHHSSIPIPNSRWSDPPFVLSYESRPGGMHSKYGRNMITDMSSGAQHDLYIE